MRVHRLAVLAPDRHHLLDSEKNSRAGQNRLKGKMKSKMKKNTMSTRRIKKNSRPPPAIARTSSRLPVPTAASATASSMFPQSSTNEVHVLLKCSVIAAWS